jgi:solute:Na+ symporter, SSS family
VVRHFRPDLGDHQSVRVGRVCTAGLMMFAVLWAPELYRFPSLWQYLQAVLAYVVPPIVVLFVLGKFWSGGNARGARATLWLGSLCGFVFFLLNGVWQVTHLHFLYAAPLLVSVDLLIFVIVSMRHPTALSASQIKAMASASDETAAARSGLPAWADYRLQAVLLMILTSALVITFR